MRKSVNDPSFFATRKDLTSALEKFQGLEGMEDYVKILETYLKKYDEDNKEDGSQEGVTT